MKKISLNVWGTNLQPSSFWIITLLFVCHFLIPQFSWSTTDQPSDPIEQAKKESLLGRELWQNQDYLKAIDHFEQAGNLDPKNENYFSNAAVCAIYLKQPERAVGFLKNAISACILKKDYAKIEQYNEQIGEVLNVWPDWAEQKVETVSELPDEENVIKAQQQWYAFMNEVQNIQHRNDPRLIEILQKAADIAEKNFGAEHPETLNSIKMLAEVYMDNEDLETAASLFKKASEGMIKELNAQHPLRIPCLRNLATIHETLGNFDEAEKYYIESLTISRQGMGVDHPESLLSMYMLAMFYIQQKELPKAVAQLEELVPLYQNRFGITHPDTLVCMDDLAALYKQQVKTASAESLYLSIVSQKVNIFGEKNTETLKTQLEIAELYRQKAELSKAESLLAKTITFAQETSGENSHLVYDLKTELARVYEDQGRLSEAETLMEACYQFDSKTLGENHPNTLTDLSHIASILRHQGQLQAAEKIFEKVYQLRQTALGESHPDSIADLNNLALVFEEQGLYERAEPLLKKAMNLAESVLGLQHITTLATMNNLALLYESQGVFNRARPLYLKVIQAYTDLLGKDHMNTIVSINNLAYLYMLDQKYDDALEQFKIVFERWNEHLKSNHQYTLKAMNNLGRVYHKLGKLNQAEPLLHRALELRILNFGETHMDAIRSTIDVSELNISSGKFTEAEVMIKKAIDFSTATLGPHHPYTFEALNVQARLFEAMKNKQKASETYAVIFERRNHFFERVLWATGENARNGYIQLHKHEQDAYLTFLSEMKTPESAREMLLVSLKRKGLLLKIASEIEQVKQMLDKPELNQLSQQLMDKKKKLAALTLSGPVESGAKQFLLTIEKLENEIEELQGELGRASIRFKTTRQDLNPNAVIDKLGDNDVLVDYFIYMNHIIGSLQLVAIVAQKSESGEPVFQKVLFGNMSDIHKWVENYRSTIQDEDADEEEVKEEGNILYGKMWQPIMKYFNEKTSIYLVPDGILNILPFDALVDEDGEYLIQTYELKMLSSGRDLLLSDEKVSKGTFIIIAGPDYNSEYLAQTETVQDIKRKRRGKRNADLMKGLRMGSFGMRGLSFAPLPGAEHEGQEINELCKKDRTTLLYLKNQAEEEQLRRIDQTPDILHIATHGFFLASQENLTKRLIKLQRSMEPLAMIPPPGDNPLLRAGLAFAGINKNAQYLGEIDTDNDGVLTALEVLGLKLFGTRLVVLSACETGLGEIHAGEGVYGLRRAFLEAGARTVLNSLWEVSDKGTQALMTGLYKNVLKGMSVRQAFRKVQLEMKNSIVWSHPYIWSAFFLVGK
ncbi:MAG: tetratricopeptide repeat protein [Candidatus Magnetomorum sp.]|nr:tetratricopeptide repeat protein [Candidatus Magnetomorum sp.]